jgi:hypothetical protein
VSITSAQATVLIEPEDAGLFIAVVFCVQVSKQKFPQDVAF